ncbi:hypothetical protein BDQ12DRAFT_724120, partial [Crucibulum laeve]
MSHQQSRPKVNAMLYPPTGFKSETLPTVFRVASSAKMISLSPIKPLQIVKKKVHGHLILDHDKSLSPVPVLSMSQYQVSSAGVPTNSFSFYIPAACEELESYDINPHPNSICSTPVDEYLSNIRHPFPIPRSPSIIALTPFAVEDDIEKLLAFVQESLPLTHKPVVSPHSAHNDVYSEVVFSSFSSGGE